MNLGSNDFIHYIELLVKETGNDFKQDITHGQEELMNDLNQMNLYSFFTQTYQPIEIKVIDNSDLYSNQSHYAALADINPFHFNEKYQPSISMTTMNPYEITNTNLENDIFIQWYFLALSLIVLYIIYQFMLKE